VKSVHSILVIFVTNAAPCGYNNETGVKLFKIIIYRLSCPFPTIYMMWSKLNAGRCIQSLSTILVDRICYSMC